MIWAVASFGRTRWAKSGLLAFAGLVCGLDGVVRIVFISSIVRFGGDPHMQLYAEDHTRGGMWCKEAIVHNFLLCPDGAVNLAAKVPSPKHNNPRVSVDIPFNLLYNPVADWAEVNPHILPLVKHTAPSPAPGSRSLFSPQKVWPGR